MRVYYHFAYTVRKLDGVTGEVTDCGVQRYYHDENGLLECCDPHCAAGCDGPSPQRCFVRGSFKPTSQKKFFTENGAENYIMKRHSMI